MNTKVFKKDCMAAGLTSLVLLFTGMVFSSSCFAVSDFFDFTNTAIGSADRRGHCLLWAVFERGIKLKSGDILPIRLRFSSDEMGDKKGLLGHGWTFPLLESSVIELDETMVSFLAPGGKTFLLYRNPNDLKSYSSVEEGIHATLLENDKFRVEDKDDYKLTFNKGLIEKLETSTGEVLSWVYHKGQVTSIKSDKTGDCFRASYMDATPLLKEIWTNDVSNNPQDVTKFEFTSVPLLGSINGNYLLIGEEKTLRSFGGKLGNGEFKYNFSSPANTLNIEWRASGPDGYSFQNCTWNLESRLILKDLLGLYRVSAPPNPWSHADIEVTNPKTGVSSYSYNEKSGECTEILNNGLKVCTHYILTPGPLFGKVREVSTEFPKVNQSSGVDEVGRRLVDRYYYDVSGQRLRWNSGKFGITFRRLDSKGGGSSWTVERGGRVSAIKQIQTGEWALIDEEGAEIGLLGKNREIISITDLTELTHEFANGNPELPLKSYYKKIGAPISIDLANYKQNTK